MHSHLLTVKAIVLLDMKLDMGTRFSHFEIVYVYTRHREDDMAG